MSCDRQAQSLEWLRDVDPGEARRRRTTLGEDRAPGVEREEVLALYTVTVGHVRYMFRLSTCHTYIN